MDPGAAWGPAVPVAAALGGTFGAARSEQAAETAGQAVAAWPVVSTDFAVVVVAVAALEYEPLWAAPGEPLVAAESGARGTG